MEQRAPPQTARQLWLTRDDARLEAWFFPPSSAPRGQGPALLYFHGNAELIDHNVALAETYAAAGYAVMLAEYRGYGRSTGRASSSELPGDAAAFYALLAEQEGVDPAKIAVLGRSLGGAAAAAVAATQAPCAVVLESTFTSLSDVIAVNGFPRFLSAGRLDNQAAVARYQGPVLVMHGRSDPVIPFAMGEAMTERLIARGPNTVSRFVTFPGGHNPMAAFPEISGTVLRFLAEDTPCAPLLPA
jgi:pimeloyl-ACP methyl ester carboxylesterase